MGISVEGQAFLLVTLAGLCTSIGAAVVFFPSLANLAKPQFLTLALGFSAGIMIYISLVDIWGKSIDGFASSGHDDVKSKQYAIFSYFGGCLIMIGLKYLVDALLAWNDKKRSSTGDSSNSNTDDDHNDSHVHTPGHGHMHGLEDGDAIRMRIEFEQRIQKEKEEQHASKGGNVGDSDIDNGIEIEAGTENENNEDTNANANVNVSSKGDGKGEGDLQQMGVAMLVAIAIHNFPEGMVTYLAYTIDPALGIALAIGIAMHNIPEGLCVSMPLYYATGSRWYSFFWGTVSGLTEPLGALLVWLILSNNGISGNANGILFGIVAGMMTIIAVEELLPTAQKYATKSIHVTWAFLFGMAFLAASAMILDS